MEKVALCCYKTATLFFVGERGGDENIHCDMPFMRVAAEQAYLKGKLFSGYEEDSQCSGESCVQCVAVLIFEELSYR